MLLTPHQDDFFRAASEYARTRGIPRIYISSNSGARIGLVDELKPKFKVRVIGRGRDDFGLVRRTW